LALYKNLSGKYREKSIKSFVWIYLLPVIR